MGVDEISYPGWVSKRPLEDNRALSPSRIVGEDELADESIKCLREAGLARWVTGTSLGIALPCVQHYPLKRVQWATRFLPIQAALGALWYVNFRDDRPPLATDITPRLPTGPLPHVTSQRQTYPGRRVKTRAVLILVTVSVSIVLSRS